MIRIPLILSLVLGAPLGATGPDDLAAPEDIGTNLQRDTSEQSASVLPVFKEWNETRLRIRKQLGFDWSASYHTMALGSTLGNGVDFGSSGDFTLQGLWAPGHHWNDNPTELRFRFRHRHAFSGNAASQLAPEVGALWGFVDGFSNSGFEIPDLYFRHTFEAIGLELRYGQMTIESQFGDHALASSKSMFFNQAFSSNPAVAFPRFGAGLTAVQSFDNGLTIGLGATTVQGTQRGDQVDLEFGSGDLFHALQFGYDFKGRDDLARRIQLLGWHSDAVEDAQQPSGEGVSLTYEQVLDPDGTRLFARLAWSEGGAAPLDYLLAGGFGKQCGDRDFLGLAAGIGRGSGPDKDIQAVIEAFYRWHPREHLEISPDIQLLVGEGLAEGPGVRLIGGLRLAWIF